MDGYIHLQWPTFGRRAAGGATEWTSTRAGVRGDDATAHLGVGKDSIYRWVESRGLPALKVGRLLRFKLLQVDAWIEAGGGEGNGDESSPVRSTNPARGKQGQR